MLSRPPEERKADEVNINDQLGRGTTEFESDEYVNLMKHIQKNAEILPDLKVENGLVTKCRILEIFPGRPMPLIEKAYSTVTVAHGEIAKTLQHLKRTKT